MTAPHRPLRVESFEDRALPSTMISISHGDWPVASLASYSSLAGMPGGRSSLDFGRETRDSVARAFRGHGIQNLSARAFEHSFVWSGHLSVFVVVYFRSGESGVQPVTRDTPADPIVAPRQFASAAEGGSDRVPADRGKTANVSPPAIAIPPSATAVASGLPASTNSASAAAFPPQVSSQPRIIVSGASTSQGLGGPLVFLGADSEEGTDLPPAEEPAPPLTVPPPAPAIAETPPMSVSVVDFAANALSGSLPLDLSALEAGARDILSRVTILDVNLPDVVGGNGEYWLLATAALVTGGVASTVRANRGRWTDRRTVGFDSVLARWGEGNGGRFD